MNNLRKALYSLVPLLVLGVGGELLARAMGWAAPAAGQPFEHNQPYWITDPDLHEEPFPHREVGGTFSVSTDSQGVRYPLHPLHKPDGVFRILLLGCSTTFGWGVDDQESYPARLEALLRDAGESEVEVINGGQPGYTSFQGLWFYQNYGRNYRPDLIFFGYVVQDARRAAYTDKSQALLQADARFLKQSLLHRSHLYLAALQRRQLARLQEKERDEDGEEGVHRVPPEDYVANIRQMNDMVESDGGRMVLFGFPLEREGYTRTHRRLLRIAADELGLPHLDPQPEMEALSRSQTLYFPQDRGHANAAGNDVIARRIATFLQDDHLLP